MADHDKGKEEALKPLEGTNKRKKTENTSGGQDAGAAAGNKKETEAKEDTDVEFEEKLEGTETKYSDEDTLLSTSEEFYVLCSRSPVLLSPKESSTNNPKGIKKKKMNVELAAGGSNQDEELILSPKESSTGNPKGMKMKRVREDEEDDQEDKEKKLKADLGSFIPYPSKSRSPCVIIRNMPLLFEEGLRNEYPELVDVQFGRNLDLTLLQFSNRQVAEQAAVVLDRLVMEPNIMTAEFVMGNSKFKQLNQQYREARRLEKKNNHNPDSDESNSIIVFNLVESDRENHYKDIWRCFSRYKPVSIHTYRKFAIIRFCSKTLVYKALDHHGTRIGSCAYAEMYRCSTLPLFKTATREVVEAYRELGFNVLLFYGLQQAVARAAEKNPTGMENKKASEEEEELVLISDTSSDACTGKFPTSPPIDKFMDSDKDKSMRSPPGDL